MPLRNAQEYNSTVRTRRENHKLNKHSLETVLDIGLLLTLRGEIDSEEMMLLHS